MLQISPVMSPNQPTAEDFLKHMQGVAQSLPKKLRPRKVGSKMKKIRQKRSEMKPGRTPKGVAGKNWRAEAYFKREAERKATNDALAALRREQEEERITESMKEAAAKLVEISSKQPTPVGQ